MQEQINAMNASQDSATMRADKDPPEQDDESVSASVSAPQVMFNPSSLLQSSPT